MRSEKEMMDLVLSLAEQDERIRIVTLEGSRANINIPKDEFQDYDITYFVSDIEPFISNDDWLNQFGNIIMMQKPEDMELFPPEEKGFSYLMLFDDYGFESIPRTRFVRIFSRFQRVSISSFRPAVKPKPFDR